MKTENLTYIDDDSEQNDQFKSAVVVQNTENSRQLSNRILAGINVNQNLVSFKQLYDSWLGLDKGLNISIGKYLRIQILLLIIY